MAAQALTILNTIIHRRGDLYSLNDLHKASGSASKHKPANFMRRDQTREMVEEIQFSEMSRFLATFHHTGPSLSK